MTRDRNTRLAYTTGGESSNEEAMESSPSAPRTKGIRLRLDRRASGRSVTVVTGAPGSAEELAALAAALKTWCGTGGTVKGGAVELQGDQRDKVEAALRARGLRFKRAGGR